MTQRQVAELSGITEIYYQSIEAGRRPNISIRIIGQLGTAFGLTISELFAPDISKVKLKVKLPQKPTPSPHYKR